MLEESLATTLLISIGVLSSMIVVSRHIDYRVTICLRTNHVVGQFVANDLIHFDRSFETIVPDCIPSEDVGLFLDFMRRALCWLPEKRATAKE